MNRRDRVDSAAAAFGTPAETGPPRRDASVAATSEAGKKQHYPVMLISGFTHPTNEFATPYRVVNWHACNSCWSDVRHRFDHKDYLWCPRHATTPRRFECTRLLTAAQAIAISRRIPGPDAPAISAVRAPTPAAAGTAVAVA